MQRQVMNRSPEPYLLCQKKGCVVSSQLPMVEQAILRELARQLRELRAKQGRKKAAGCHLRAAGARHIHARTVPAPRGCHQRASGTAQRFPQGIRRKALCKARRCDERENRGNAAALPLPRHAEQKPAFEIHSRTRHLLQRKRLEAGTVSARALFQAALPLSRTLL